MHLKNASLPQQFHDANENLNWTPTSAVFLRKWMQFEFLLCVNAIDAKSEQFKFIAN